MCPSAGVDAARDVAQIIAAIAAMRTSYGPAARAKRRRLLRQAARQPIEDAVLLVNYHELLLFLAAFPDDKSMLRLCEAELARVATSVQTLVARGGRAHLRCLDDSGIAGTVTYCQFSVHKATWLAQRYRRDTEIAWQDESAGGGVDTMLGTLVESVESNGLDDVSRSTEAWLRLARGPGARERESDLLWLLRHFERLELEPHIRDCVFDILELQICWRLRRRDASRTFGRMPGRALHFQLKPLERVLDVSRVWQQAPPKGGYCTARRAKAIIDIARTALAVRQRETDPVTFASINDVALFDMGRGVDVALFGHQAGHRTPIETYYGYILAKNRVPMAYGGGWIFCGRCEIGINIFETFRGGESMNTLAQLLRLYRHHFGIARFTVHPYQIGADNPEAIRTGALWFYYRFGFRSQDADTRVAAEREWQRLQNETGYRTSARTLKRLVEYPLELELEPVDRSIVFEPTELSIAITGWIGERFAGERARARRWSIRRVRRALGPLDQSRWREAEIKAFEDFCVLMGPIPDLARWPVTDCAALVRLMRAKGGPRESIFARRLNRHRRLREAWKQIVHLSRS